MITIQSQLFRPQPKMGVQSYKTYAVRTPKQATVRVSCERAECDAHRLGWKTVLDTSDAAQLQLAHWIRDESGRRYFWEMAGTVITFDFPAGQACFREHREQVKPSLFVVRDGDYRGNPSGWKVQLAQRDWLDDFGEHQLTLAEAQKRG